MTDHAEGTPQAHEHQEPREVRVAASHPHDEHAPAPADAAHAEHGGHESSLGPVNVEAWAVGVLGMAIGLVVAFCFAVSTGYVG